VQFACPPLGGGEWLRKAKKGEGSGVEGGK